MQIVFILIQMADSFTDSEFMVVFPDLKKMVIYCLELC